MSVLKKLMKKLPVPDGSQQSLKQKTIYAAAWSFLGRGGDAIIRLSSNLVLTRLLYPEAFGLIATASVVLAMVQLFSDTGTHAALIQNPRGNETRYINTAWMINVLRSFFLFIVMLILMQPLAEFYQQPTLRGLLMVMSFTLLISGFNNPALPMVIRKLDIKKQVTYELGAQVLGFICTLVLAWLLRSVWAMAFGYLAVGIFRLIGSYLVLPYRPRFQWSREAGKSLIHFGKYIFLNTLITWATLNLDRLMIGKLLDMETLGLYNIGLQLGVMIEALMTQIFSQSFFPAMSSVAGDRGKVLQIYRSASRMLVGTAIPILLMMLLFASDVIAILYEPRYELAALAMSWIAIRGIFHTFGIVQSCTMISLGKPVFQTIAMGVGAIVLGTILPLGAESWGLTGVCVAVLITGISTSLIQAGLLIRFFKFPAAVVLQPWGLAIKLLTPLLLFYYFLKPLMNAPELFNIPFIFLMGFLSAVLSTIFLFPGKITAAFQSIGASISKRFMSV